MNALLWAAASAPAWACGGAAAAEKVAYAQRVGLSAAGMSLLMAAVAALFVWRRGISWRILAPMAVVFFAHPGLWMDPAAPDCGQQMIMASLVFSMQSAALLGWVLARPRIIRRLEEQATAVVVSVDDE